MFWGKPSLAVSSKKGPKDFDALDQQLAAQIQRSMLPRIPRSRTWQIGYHYQPLAAVSGDLVDFYQFGDEFFDEDASSPDTGILLADASGHGISAALVTMISRQIFFRAHRDHRSEGPSAAMFNANVELLRDVGGTGLYLSCVYIELRGDGIRYVNGSHPKLLWFSQANRKTYALPNNGFLFGVEGFKGDLTDRTVHCGRGDIILAYTDGLTETSAGNDDERIEFGTKRVTASIWKTLAAWPAGEIPADGAEQVKKNLLEAFKTFCAQGASINDDVSFVVMVKSA